MITLPEKGPVRIRVVPTCLKVGFGFLGKSGIMPPPRWRPYSAAKVSENPAMFEPAPRLGDVIDDYCPRCRLLLNHAVASLVDNKVVKVVCQTCHSEHPYRYAEIPPKKKPSPRKKLFTDVLSKAAPASAPKAADEETPDSEPEKLAKKKKAAAPARYISRHGTRPPRGKH